MINLKINTQSNIYNIKCKKDSALKEYVHKMQECRKLYGAN